MTINRYDKGDIVRVDGVFTDQAGAFIDPVGVNLSYKNPSGTTVTLVYGVDQQPVRASTGTYWANIDASVAGRWFYRWFSTGTGQAAMVGEFYVESAPL